MKKRSLRTPDERPVPFIGSIDTDVAIRLMGSLHLTSRELQVLCWVASGRTNLQIAHELGVSFFTIKSHVDHILRRLDVSRRTAAAAAFFREFAKTAK